MHKFDKHGVDQFAGRGSEAVERNIKVMKDDIEENPIKEREFRRMSFWVESGHETSHGFKNNKP